MSFHIHFPVKHKWNLFNGVSHMVESATSLEPRNLTFVQCVPEGYCLRASVRMLDLAFNWLQKKE